jgi:hypothetical protein
MKMKDHSFFPNLCKPCDETDRVHEKRDRWEVTPRRNILQLIKKDMYIYIERERERKVIIASNMLWHL